MPALQRVLETVQYENLARHVDTERCSTIRIIRVEERQRYCAAGTEQHHIVSVTDIADIRYSAYDRVFCDTSERNRLTFHLPRAIVPDIRDIIGPV